MRVSAFFLSRTLRLCATSTRVKLSSARCSLSRNSKQPNSVGGRALQTGKGKGRPLPPPPKQLLPSCHKGGPASSWGWRRASMPFATVNSGREEVRLYYQLLAGEGALDAWREAVAQTAAAYKAAAQRQPPPPPQQQQQQEQQQQPEKRWAPSRLVQLACGCAGRGNSGAEESGGAAAAAAPAAGRAAAVGSKPPAPAAAAVPAPLPAEGPDGPARQPSPPAAPHHGSSAPASWQPAAPAPQHRPSLEIAASTGGPASSASASSAHASSAHAPQLPRSLSRRPSLPPASLGPSGMLCGLAAAPEPGEGEAALEEAEAAFGRAVREVAAGCAERLLVIMGLSGGCCCGQLWGCQVGAPMDSYGAVRWGWFVRSAGILAS